MPEDSISDKLIGAAKGIASGKNLKDSVSAMFSSKPAAAQPKTDTSYADAAVARANASFKAPAQTPKVSQRAQTRRDGTRKEYKP